MVFELCERIDRQTDRQTDEQTFSSQYFRSFLKLFRCVKQLIVVKYDAFY